MKISYYTIDDMRLGHDPKGITGWRIRHFLSLDKALAQYRTMSPRGIKTLGVTDGVRVLELVRCQPLFPDDKEGEDVLAVDYRTLPLWCGVPEVAEAEQKCIAMLRLRYLMEKERIYDHYLGGASLRMLKEELETEQIPCFEDSPEWSITRIRSILQNEKYCGDVLMQKTFRQDFISRKTIKNTGQLPMYLIENHHEGIVDRDKFNKVQTEMARRSAARSPSQKAPTGLTSYASKYALSERLVCGECGTLYRRCTWTQKGEKRIVWRCVSRLDYGKKYCHSSPTLDEAPLQQAILTAITTMMASKETLIRQITGSLKTEVIPFHGGGLSLGDIDRRLAELEAQFQKLLKQATNDPAAYSGQFKEILDEQTYLKEKRTAILAESKHNAEINQKIMDAAELLDRDALTITEWDESVIRQMVETVKVLSKNEIIVTLKGGAEIKQGME